jgi:hypothetical protein
MDIKKFINNLDKNIFNILNELIITIPKNKDLKILKKLKNTHFLSYLPKFQNLDINILLNNLYFNMYCKMKNKEKNLLNFFSFFKLIMDIDNFNTEKYINRGNLKPLSMTYNYNTL